MMSNVLVAVDHKENRRLLLEALGQYHQVAVYSEENFSSAFDLGVFDGQALDRLWRQVRMRKNAAYPLFLPILLVTTRQDIRMITRQLWQVIDEILLMPIEKNELFVRVEVLLRARRLSLELEGKTIQLHQEFVAHREANQALQASEERFSVALKNSPIMVAHIDMQLCYTWVYNAHYVFNVPEVLGKHDDELLPPAAAAALTALKREVLKSGQGVRQEIEIRVANQTRVFDVTIEPIWDNLLAIVGVTMAAQDITERKQAEQHLREVVALEERQRLARDLHDAANQTVFTMNMLAQTLPRLWQQSPEKVPGHLEQMVLLGRGAMSEMRTLLLELRPANIVQTKFEDLVTHLVQAAQVHKTLAITTSIDLPEPLDEEVHVTLYRIVQESLNNIVKHSSATEASISLRVESGRQTLRIQDNGSGFNPDATNAGLGMSVMQERVALIGAALTINSVVGQGTEIVVTLP